MTQKFLIVLSFLIASVSFSQDKGFLRGNIIDGDNGEPMYGAKVKLKSDPTVGAMSDFDGNYSLQLPVGTYDIEISSTSFETQIFEKIVIVANDVTILNTILSPPVQTEGDVIVVGKADTRGDVGFILERKETASVSDGITGQSMSKTGDGDLGQAMKRVTGVTIANGQDVFVRGLGDRYTQTTLNGLVIPGLDPDKNSVQMDIFPTSLLENVSVFKTASPELYGDFTGGLVNIVTRKFPLKKTTQIGGGIGYNPAMQYNKNFILYEGGKTDWTGFDDGSRKIPFNPKTLIPDETKIDPKLESLTRSFNPNLAAQSATANLNTNFFVNHGNQLELKKGGTFGYNLVFNYSNEYKFYQDYESSDYLKDTDPSVTQLTKVVTRIGDVGKNSVLWSALASASYKKNTNVFQITLLNSQNAESTAAKRINQDFNQNQSILQEDVLTYSQKNLTSLMISGNHRIKKVEVNWANAISRSKVDDPDFRETRISVGDGDTTLSTGNGAGIDRFWRYLNEYDNASKLDIIVPIKKKIEFKTGLASTLKFRDFSVYSFKLRRNDLSNIEADPDWFLKEENIWSSDINRDSYKNGTYVIGNFQPANTYSARQTVFAAYTVLVHPIKEFAKFSYGLRVEKADMYYTGQNNEGSIIYNDEKTLDELNLLPSANLNFFLNKEMNIRLGASSSVARPSFKEKSIAQIYDPITKRTFNGNIDLEQTNINNYDLRYEWYMSPRELFSVSGFYKQFDGHIEMVSFIASPNNLTPRNSGSANLVGTEIEIRKAFAVKDTSNGFASKLFFTGNLSFVKSQVDMQSVLVDSKGQTEYDFRTTNAREGETVNRFRPMAGQSPYSINASFSYEDIRKGTSVALSYNVQGEQLTIIASGRVPDVYTQPFHSLNFNAFQKFGKESNSKMTLGVNNILNDDRLLVYKSFNATSQTYNKYKPGVEFNLKYTYTF